MEHKHHKHHGHSGHHEGMIDNGMVHDTHQEGIHRVTQKHHNPMDSAGHHGKMGKNHSMGGFGRHGGSTPPTKA